MDNKLLEELIHLGHLEKEYDKLGKKIKMRTLTTGELTECDAAAAGKDILTYSRQIKVECLARSILSISGIPFESMTILDKVKLLNNCSGPVVDSMYECYLDLTDAQNKILSDQDLGENIKNLQGTPEAEPSSK